MVVAQLMDANLGLEKKYNLLNFDPNKNWSGHLILYMKRSRFTRYYKKIRIFGSLVLFAQNRWCLGVVHHSKAG